MKRLLPALLLILCGSLHAQTTVLPKTVILQKGVVFGGAAAASSPVVSQAAGTCVIVASSCNAVLGSSLTAGHRLLVFTLSNGVNTTPTMTGETFTIYTGASGCQNNTGDTINCWLVTSAVGGQTTVGCATAGSVIGCIAIDITSPVGNSPKDAGGNSQVGSGTSYTVSTSATTTNTGDLVIACFGSLAATGTYSAGAPYVSVSGGTFGLTTLQMICESNTPGSTGTQTATATQSSSGSRNAAGIIAIAP